MKKLYGYISGIYKNEKNIEYEIVGSYLAFAKGTTDINPEMDIIECRFFASEKKDGFVSFPVLMELI